MKNVLLRIAMSGIKNIEEKIVIDFHALTIKNKIDKIKDKVKVIYGANGAGKSAIMNAIELYLRINSSNYLVQARNVEKVRKMINSKSKTFYFNVVFAECRKNDSVRKVYSHEIEIKIVDNAPMITLEKMSLLSDQTINGNYKKVYEVVKGELVYPTEGNNLFNFIKDKTKNLLILSPLSSMLVTNMDVRNEIIHNYNNSTKDIEMVTSLIDLFSFSNDIRVYLDDSDKHNIIDIKEMLRNLQKIFSDDSFNIDEINIDSHDEEISKKDYPAYVKKIKKLEAFLKLFKSNLNEIKIDLKEDINSYHCSKILVYNDYTIDSEYESTGIKKMMKVFSYLDSAIDGQIVFIDEMDANISSVYLNKFIEYFLEYGKGTLCFTSHNFEPMNILKRNKRAIYFLGETGKIYPWVNNGNANVINNYKEGMIEDSPYNIEAYDFIKVFGLGDDE